MQYLETFHWFLLDSDIYYSVQSWWRSWFCAATTVTMQRCEGLPDGLGCPSKVNDRTVKPRLHQATYCPATNNMLPGNMLLVAGTCSHHYYQECSGDAFETFQTSYLWIECAARELRELTKNYRLGLGTFVDKTTMPYVHHTYRQVFASVVWVHVYNKQLISLNCDICRILRQWLLAKDDFFIINFDLLWCFKVFN